MFNQRQQEQMMQALSAFVNADNWLESKRIVQQAQALLLTDEAELALLALLAQYADNEQMVDILVQHSVLLKACRSHGIEAAFAAKMRPAGLPDVSPEMMQRMLAVQSEEELAQLFQAHPELLPFLAASQQAAAEKAVAPRIELVQKLQEFMGLDRWDESRRYLHEHPELLSDDALNVAQMFIDQAEEEGVHDAVRMFRDHRELLLRAREQGIDAAFAERISSTGQTRVMKQIEALMECDSLRAVLELAAEQPILLSDEVEQILQESINNWRAQGTPQSEAMAEHVEARLASLRQVRKMMAQSEMTAQEILQGARTMDEMPDESLQEALLVEPLQAFVMSDHWLAAREVVEEHPELLSAEADAVLAQWLAEAKAQNNAEAVQHFKIFRERLARARQEGLDAIAPPMSAEKLSMMEELASLPEEVRNLFLTLVQNASSAEELHAALQEYPELLPVLSQVMGWR